MAMKMDRVCSLNFFLGKDFTSALLTSAVLAVASACSRDRIEDNPRTAATCFEVIPWYS